MEHRRLAACALALVVGVAAPPAASQPARPSGSDAQASAALSRFDEGRKAYEAGRFEEALIAFKASLELQPSPNTRLYVGRCHRALGKTASAYTSLRLASREAQDRLATTGEKRYSATRDTAASEAAELEPRVPRLTLSVPSDLPAGFSITLDGTEVAPAAWGTAMEIDPGRHEVRASGARLSAFSESVEVSEGEQRRVDVRARRLPTATLTVAFATRPAGMTVEIDGRPVDPADAERMREVDVGTHEVVVRAAGFEPFVWRKDLADRDRSRVEVALTPEPAAARRSGGTPSFLFWGALGATGALATAGAVFGVKASSAAADEEAKDSLARDPAIRDGVEADAMRANVLLAGSAVVAVGAAVLFFTTDWKRSEPGKKRGWVRPGAGSFAAGGSF